jgi:hypothetical protein
MTLFTYGQIVRFRRGGQSHRVQRGNLSEFKTNEVEKAG